MSTEYRLSYTASEINRKLGEIDNLASKNEIPYNTSDLVNDSGFATENYVRNYAQPKNNYALKSEIPEVPVKSVNQQTGDVNLTAEDVGALPSDTVIPSALADLTDDNAHRLVTDNEKSIWNAKSNFSGNYNDLTNKPTIPSIDGLATEEYVTSQISAIPTPDVSGQISTHNTATDAHNDIRLLVDGLTTRLNTLANSTDEDLDQMSEIVAYIKSNKSLIEQVTTNKVNVADIINNLTTNVSDKPLSAAQGVALKALIDAIKVPTKVSELTNDKNYLTSIPSEYVTETELNAKGYLTEHQSLDGYAKISDLEDLADDVVYIDITDNENVEETTNGSVLYTVQTLTDSQKSQARNNIGAISYADVNVLFTEIDELREALRVTPVLGSIDDDNNIVLIGNLADGEYTLKYENNGEYTEIGTLTVGAGEPVLAPDTTIVWQIGTKIDSSTGAESTSSTYAASNYVEIVDGFEYTLTRSTTEFACKVCYYDANQNFISCSNDWMVQAGGKLTDTVPLIAGASYIRLRVYGAVNTLTDQFTLTAEVSA